MSAPAETARAPWRVVAAALVAVGTAGCSSEVTRFDDNPFANPSARRSPPSEVTGAATPPTSPAPTGRVEAQPLPQPSYQSQSPSYQSPAYQPLPPPPSPYQQQSAITPGTSSGSSGIASYSPSPQSDITGAVRPPPPTTSAKSGWEWDGGTVVIVAPGETVDSLSRRYGVPSAAIMRANGLSGSSHLQPGERIVIPRYNYASVAAAPADRAKPPKPGAVVAGGAPSMSRGARLSQGTVHVVQANETLISIAKRYGKSVAEIAAANHIPPYTHVRMGDRITIPGASVAAIAPKQHFAPAAPPAASAPAQKFVVADPPVHTHVVTPDPPVDEAIVAPATGGTTSFGWPAHGRVITGFGEKLPNGQTNDGINLAVPEGTPVRAAEDGVVAYAGSELRGYGNLILVRHSNGFVTAYAHASEILVKRNDQVKRGQVIARSGATGSVKSPQLHFETRKGSAPVNPMQYLPAGA
jgi:murein DD-endopeptidase MepM/ murein hydrolase activator NlpD